MLVLEAGSIYGDLEVFHSLLVAAALLMLSVAAALAFIHWGPGPILERLQILHHK